MPSGVPTWSLRAVSTFWSVTTGGPLSPMLSLPATGSVTFRDVDRGVGCVCADVVGCPVAGVVVVPGRVVGGSDAFCGVDPTAAGLPPELPPPEVAMATAIAVTTTSASARRARIRRRRTIVSGPAGAGPCRRPSGLCPSGLPDRKPLSGRSVWERPAAAASPWRGSSSQSRSPCSASQSSTRPSWLFRLGRFPSIAHSSLRRDELSAASMVRIVAIFLPPLAADPDLLQQPPTQRATPAGSRERTTHERRAQPPPLKHHHEPPPVALPADRDSGGRPSP